jgi:glutamate-1-semialdehyde aminotransferase
MFGRKLTPTHGVAYIDHNIPPRMPANTLRACWLTLENRGAKAWKRRRRLRRGVGLALHLDDAYQTTVELPCPVVRPGERVTLHCKFRAPAAVGRHELEFGLVKWSGMTYDRRGAAPLRVIFDTTAQPPSATSRLMEEAFATNCWFSLPSQGISWSTTDHEYPLFAREAKGCRITDLEGRQYIDYVMGWGCALLGYANERVQRAVADSMCSAGVLSLPPLLEMDVTRMLCADLECAEMAVFSKNGSDVCTAAARLARSYTGRLKILVCGYHGWQDWYVESKGLRASGVPRRAKPLTIHFPFNDLAEFKRLMKKHRGQVAAVMLEPAGPVADWNSPIFDADPEFLGQVAAVARSEGSLLIFDEIMTGFRYPHGSVQRATGVTPDLACFGKALSAGMPLSALVGRRPIFEMAMSKIFYGPTFKSEAYSFAAAKEALTIYQEQDVPGHVWAYGNRLKGAVNQLCQQSNIPAEVTGPPFRMNLIFKGPDEQRIVLMRTLVQQELIRKGVITYRGFMLPSLAHDEQAFRETIDAFQHAFSVLTQAARQDAYAKYLEIPPLASQPA